MKIVNYTDHRDIDVEFLMDGTIKKHCSYYHFINGSILHPDMKRKSYNSGNIIGNKYGKLTVIRVYKWEEKEDLCMSVSVNVVNLLMRQNQN